MKAATWISGIIGLVLLLLFLGKYALTINAIPLWIIIIACFAMPVVDFVQAVREEPESDEGNGGTAS